MTTTKESTDIHRLLSDHFTLFELVRSVRAELLEMDNMPDEKQVKNLTNLCRHILEPTRIALGDSIYVTSGYRTPLQNQSAGGVMHSSHTMGLAVDMSCRSSHVRYRMVSGLILAGFNRIGLYTSHLHADIDESLPQDVLWLGGESH